MSDLSSRRETAFDLQPDADARAALAAQLGLDGLRKLRFVGKIAPSGARGWTLTAELGATVVQPCVVTLEPFLHLGLRRQDDAIVVFGVLKVVLSHDTVTGTLRITREVHVFFRHMLGSSANFYIGTGAVIGTRQWILALAVAATIVGIVSAASATALVLLSWPHTIVTWLCS